jgi:hypothetical protein
MKPTLGALLLLLLVFCSAAYAQCTSTPCPKKVLHTLNIGDCPKAGCTQKKGHKFDPELDKLKNIQSDERKPDLQSFESIKGLPTPSPTDYTKCGNRDALQQLGEGKKITITAWALHGDTQGPESCNCDLPYAENHDTHIVLVDPLLTNPTLDTDKSSCVVAEFTPRVRLDHHNFTTTVLNRTIRHNGNKLFVRVTGLLMFDSKHFFDQPKPTTRATYWEIHPVLKFEYCDEGKTCRAESDENWKDLDNEPPT